MKNPRINQYLVRAGLADSRRKADEIIKSGKVKINGQTMADLSYRVKKDDQVLVNGQVGKIRTNIYIVYNKPTKEICSHKTQGQSPTIFQNLPKSFAKLKIAGRLDKNSHGLVVLSSDGHFTQSISHPSQSKNKVYIVKTKQSITKDAIKKLNCGVILEDGISKLKASKIKSNTLRIELQEGRNRQIRRSLKRVGLDVVDLERVSIGKYFNRNLKEGEFEFVKPEDLL